VTSPPARFHLEVEPVIASVVRARDAATRWLTGTSTISSSDDRAALGLVVTETVANAVHHGRPGPVTLDLTLAEGVLVGEVRDRGTWRGPEADHLVGHLAERTAAVDAERGRGLTLAAALVDEFAVAPSAAGTAVRFVRHLGAGGRRTDIPPSGASDG
jgi:anti-sigma regulatory factor (Ser/Thr protein kinase)